MQLYLPCSRFKVQYILSIGAPYSRLDQLILRSVSDGVHTVEELSEIFKLNNSVLLQSLVTLIQAGWLALGDTPATQFSLTLQGIQAINTKQIPKSIIYRQETTEILLEHVSGCLIPREEVVYRNFIALNINKPWDHPQVLRTEVTKKSPEQGEVQNLLPRRSGERLHWIQEIRRVSRDYECIPLDVDIENGKIVNFPSHRSLLLQEKIIRYAEKIMRQQQDPSSQFIKKGNKPHLIQNIKDNTLFALPQDTYEVSWNSSDLITTSEEMSASLLDAFEQAFRYILITSREMSINFIEEIETPLFNAVKRGVKISMLWGKRSDKESLDRLGRFTYQIKTDDLAGSLSYNKEPCKFNASLVIFDKEKSVFNAIIGNHDWLCSSTKQDAVLPEFGFRVSHPEVTASLARIVGGYIDEMDSHSMKELENLWKRIAAEISLASEDVENSPVSETEPLKVRLVQNTSDHLNALIELTELSTKRFFILSDSLDSTGIRRLTGNSKFLDSEVKSVAVVGVTENRSNPEKKPEMDYLFEDTKIKTNVIATEKAVCITSYPPLLGMDLMRAEENLGIVIYGNDFAKTVLDQIEKSILPKI